MEPFPDLFPPADKAAWRAQVQKDLNDASAPDSLRWQTDLPGRTGIISLEPYYTAEDLTTLPLGSIQAAQKRVPGWLNVPEVLFTDEKTTNAHLLDLLQRGADGFILDLTQHNIESILLPKLLHAIKLSDTPIWFRVTGQSAELAAALTNLMPYQLKGGLLDDPIAHGLQTAETGSQAVSRPGEASGLMGTSPQFRTVCAGSHVFHNAGANAVQELAFLFGSLADQYDALTETGAAIDQLIPKTVLSLSVGTTYFTEIAKLRAVRVLWYRFLTAYPIPPTLTATSPFILAQTSTFYDATRSPYTNLLRATTEAMAAVIGGCDGLTVHSYRAVFEQPATLGGQESADREHAERIARNVSVLMAEESYLDKVADPSAGSYYVETLTNELAEAAWALFLRVEAMGGLSKAVAVGFVQAEIDAAYQTKLNALNNGRVMVGVNKFRANDDPQPGSSTAPPILGAALPNRRLATEFE